MARQISPLKDLVSFGKILRFLLRTKPDAVNAGTPKAGLLVLTAAFLCRVPLRFFVAHGARLEHASGLEYYIFKALLIVSCFCSHRVFCVSKSVRSALVKHGVCNPEKTTVLHYGTANGIDAERFNPALIDAQHRLRLRRSLKISDNATVLLFMGRLVRDKGILELERAWSVIKQRYPDTCLLLVGPEEKVTPVPYDVMNRLKNDARVRLTGHADDPVPFYAISDILILPTYREGFPYVPMEAAAMELPVVATRVTGCVDAIIDGVTGLLVPPRDVDALVHAIELYLENPDMAASHGRAGRQRVIKFFRPADIWSALHQEYIVFLKKRVY